MPHSARKFLETEVKILAGQVLKLNPGVLDAKDYEDGALSQLADQDLIALVDELKDLMRTLGGVRRR